MRIDRVYLVGAGGHGKVVLDALLESGISLSSIRVRDEAPHLYGVSFLGCTVEPFVFTKDVRGNLFHLAIGVGAVRKRLFTELVERGGVPLSVIHPSASISRFSTIGSGFFGAARAVVAPSTALGVGVIVNHGAVVDHDCVVGDFSHIAPNATLGGGVKVGAGALIGAGANILPRVVVGAGAVIGAGAVVTADVEAGAIYVGIPAKKVLES